MGGRDDPVPVSLEERLFEEKEVSLVSTYAPPVHVHRLHVNVWLVAVLGLAAALVALATWVLVDRYAGGDTATQDATTLIDKFSAAVSANFSADSSASETARAVGALLTSDAVMWSNGDTFSGRDAIVTEIAYTPLRVARTAPVTVNGDFASTFSTFSVRGLVDETPMVTVFQLKDGKIFRFWNFGLGVTPPFDTIATP